LLQAPTVVSKGAQHSVLTPYRVTTSVTRL
jgi:hypothetical protein